jgi:hypothetical protein
VEELIELRRRQPFQLALELVIDLAIVRIPAIRVLLLAVLLHESADLGVQALASSTHFHSFGKRSSPDKPSAAVPCDPLGRLLLLRVGFGVGRSRPRVWQDCRGCRVQRREPRPSCLPEKNEPATPLQGAEDERVEA